ncbi:MAG: hypothetical protein U0359_33570 [Byssovorax sp.]
MWRAALHDLSISWSVDPALDADPLGELLAMLGPRGRAAGEAEGQVHVEQRLAGAEAGRDPAEEGMHSAFFHGAIQAYSSPRGFLLWDRASRVLVPLDGAPLVAALVRAEAEPSPGSSVLLLQIALSLALRRFGLFHAHAAALGHPSRAAVLIAGASGAGKTTTTLSLIDAGFGYLGDDALFLREAAEDGVIEALAFPRAFHLGRATLSAFPHLRAFSGPEHPRSHKRALDARAAYPGREQAALSLRPGEKLLLFPSVTGEATTQLAQLSKAEAFGVLLASSAALVIEGMPHREESFRMLRVLVDHAICREIRLGRDLLEDPGGVIGALVEGAR